LRNAQPPRKYVAPLLNKNPQYFDFGGQHTVLWASRALPSVGAATRSTAFIADDFRLPRGDDAEAKPDAAKASVPTGAPGGRVAQPKRAVLEFSA
jgi:hypothetical protein